MRLAAILAAALLLVPALALADGSAEPKLTQHVTDRTGTLSAQQLAELEAPLVELEKRKGSQIAVLLIASTGGQPIEEYALQVAEANKLGRAKPDDGLLMLIAKDDRKARIEVGYGLEGAVTDAQASRVIREYLAPHFRQDDYFGGIRDASAVLVKLVDGEPLPAPMAEEPAADGSSALITAVFLGWVIGLIAGRTGLKPALLRRAGAAAIAGGIVWLIFSLGLMVAIAAVVAFLVSSAGTGRFGSGRGGWGSFPGGGGGWGGSGGGGGSWSGGGGSFGGGGASGGW